MRSDHLPAATIAWIFLVLSWAAIYLPALGSIELKGEEGRRAMPGLEMIDNHEWLVPRVGGERYFRKPPLINWLAAAGVMVTGRRDEWAVRLPSALAMLALALATYGLGRGACGELGAFCAAIFILTNIGLMEQGRKIEIEAPFTAVFGCALLVWLRGWWSCSPGSGLWTRWLGAGAFLGLGMLLKGPLHLLFFYAIVSAVLVSAGELRELGRLPHFAGLLFAIAIFCAWAVPHARAAASEEVTAVWLEQFTQRLNGEMSFSFANWLRNLFFQSWINFLPWVLFLPFAWQRPSVEERKGRTYALGRGLRWGLGSSYIAVMLAPGASPRYVLPLVVPASLLLGLRLGARDAGIFPAVSRAWRPSLRLLGGIALGGGFMAIAYGIYAGRSSPLPPHLQDGWWLGSVLGGCATLGVLLLFCRDPAQSPLRRLTLQSSLLMAWIVLVYGIVAPPLAAAHERHRALAGELERIVPPPDVLFAFKPDSVPAFFYLTRKLSFVHAAAGLPPAARFVFIPEDLLPRLTEGGAWAISRQCLRYVDAGKRVYLLVEVESRNASG